MPDAGEQAGVVGDVDQVVAVGQVAEVVAAGRVDVAVAVHVGGAVGGDGVADEAVAGVDDAVVVEVFVQRDADALNARGGLVRRAAGSVGERAVGVGVVPNGAAKAVGRGVAFATSGR